ncbi:unnamed protein product, partial [Didymodactylos carnosus]
CDCLSLTTGGGICGYSAVSCSAFLHCRLNNTCSNANSVCVNTTRCVQPICYPLALADTGVCPALPASTIITTITPTATTTGKYTTFTTISSTRATSTITKTITTARTITGKYTTFTTISSTSTASTPMMATTFQKQALTQTNYDRALQCAPVLTLNATLNSIAQNYATFLATNEIFQHSGNTLNGEALGENLWALWSSGIINPNTLNGSSPCNSWYNEISSYNWTNPGFSSATGHFTQLVWQGTKIMGIGIALTSNQQQAYVVANYYPAGNIINSGYFGANVKKPPC